MNGFVVVDASLAFKWLVPENDSDKARELARLWDSSGTQPVAPHLMPVEVANGLHRRVIRDELTLPGCHTSHGIPVGNGDQLEGDT